MFFITNTRISGRPVLQQDGAKARTSDVNLTPWQRTDIRNVARSISDCTRFKRPPCSLRSTARNFFRRGYANKPRTRAASENYYICDEIAKVPLLMPKNIFANEFFKTARNLPRASSSAFIGYRIRNTTIKKTFERLLTRTCVLFSFFSGFVFFSPFSHSPAPRYLGEFRSVRFLCSTRRKLTTFSENFRYLRIS